MLETAVFPSATSQMARQILHSSILLWCIVRRKHQSYLVIGILGILDCVLPNAESNVIVPDEDTELPQIDDNLLASSPASPTQSEMVVRRAVRSKRLVFDPKIQDMVSRQANSVDVKRMKRMFETAVEENIRNIEAYVTGLKELIEKLQYQKHLLVYKVLELEENEKCLRRRLLQEDMDDGLEFHIQLV